jgi:spore germination protein
MLEHNVEGRDLPKTNMHLFLSDYYRTGKSAYLPLIKKAGKDRVKIVGIAIFSEDKVVDTVPERKMVYFKLMAQKLNGGSITVNIGKETAVIEDFTSKPKRKLVARNPYEVEMVIKADGIAHQFTGKRMTNKVRKELEQTLKKQIETTCSELIKQFQKEGVDPLGFGHFVKTKTRGFDYEHWKRTDYKKLKVTVKADVEILESGVVE